MVDAVWRIVVMVAPWLVIGAFVAIVVRLSSRSGARGSAVQASSCAIHVEGMTCGSCATRVGDAARAVPGVSRADVRLEDGLLIVDGTADRRAVCSAVEKAGYATRVEDR